MPEKFAPGTGKHPETGKSLEETISAPDSRRSVLFAYLERAAKDPDILRNGLDTEKLNGLIDVEFKPPKPGERSDVMDSFMARFHPGIKYAPLSAIEAAPEADLSPELRTVRDFMPYLRAKLKEKAAEVGFEPALPRGEAVVVGFAKKDPDAKLLGGYHASLNEQGYKIFDALLQENIRLEGTEQPEFRAMDMLRSIAHDFTHATQYKLFGRASAEPDSAQPGPDDINIKRYGLAMPGHDHGIMIDGVLTQFSLGAAIFEHGTDSIARDIVREYFEERGGLPEPKSMLEALSIKDLNGEAIMEDDVKDLPPEDAETGRFMVNYGKDIVRPMEGVLSLMGGMREPFIAAAREASFTGKYTRLADLRPWMDQLPPENVEKLKAWAIKGAIFLRPLFEGKEFGKAAMKARRKSKKQ